MHITNSSEQQQQQLQRHGSASKIFTKAMPSTQEEFKEHLKKLFENIYLEVAPLTKEHWMEFDALLDHCTQVKKFIQQENKKEESLFLKHRHPLWYKHVVVYSLYVDLFNKTFQGLIEKLDYLKELGVDCIWMLPVLDSPFTDGGFDIRDYNSLRKELYVTEDSSSQEEQTDGGISIFKKFIAEAHKRGIHVLMDMALNHTSNEHHWFQKAIQHDPFYRDFFIFSKDTSRYKEAPILFYTLSDSNWENIKGTDDYFFHRFLNTQPDLNYKNPNVLFAMTRVLLFWMQIGVDAFRQDAVPFLWKEEGTNCEGLAGVHRLLKFWRSVLDYVNLGTMMLAEACYFPKVLKDYFGNDDECQTAYNFPIMKNIYVSMAEENRKSLFETIEGNLLHAIPKDCIYFLFLRCHDELTLEMVEKSKRRHIFDYYLNQHKEWIFKEEVGISARVADLMKYNPQSIQLAFSILFTITGTPILYYGDEVAKTNDSEYYQLMSQKTGFNDTRYYCRGMIDWKWVEEQLKDHNSLSYLVTEDIKNKLRARKTMADWIGDAEVKLVPIQCNNSTQTDDSEYILAYERYMPHVEENRYKGLLCVHNLSRSKTIQVELPYNFSGGVMDMLNKEILIVKSTDKNDHLCINMPPLSHHWFSLKYKSNASPIICLQSGLKTLAQHVVK